MIDFQDIQQQQNAIKQLIPKARQLLPYQHLLSIPAHFISQSRPLTTQNHLQKYEPLGPVGKTTYKFNQMSNSITNLFNNPIYQRFEEIQIFPQQYKNFNFVKYPLSNNREAKIQNQRHVNHNNSDDLIFDSQFQSGNLSKVQKISATQYNLLIQNDVNTFGYNQWFFFKVKNKSKLKIKFNIVNMYKSKSLYKDGMKLAIFSQKKFKEGQAWERGGEQIQYFTNNLTLRYRKHHTLSWTYNFTHQFDQVYFAYNYPYTYTDLNKYLDKIQKSNLPFVKRRILCHTISGNRVDYLTITAPKSNQYKKYVLLSARVHPGETVSSFMMKGIIDYLLSPEAQILREKYVFRLIPMLNPDGVINGNYRCSLSGNDLNRKWKNPTKQFFPEIYYFKKMILKIAKQKQLELFCDLHGHSTKKSIFFYGCQNIQNPYASRQFPFIMSKLTKNVNYKSCNFHTQNNKLGTARISLYNQTNLPRIYTIQSSFCGPITQQSQYTPLDYENQGKSICKTILIYSNLKQNNVDFFNYRDVLGEDLKTMISQSKNILDELYSSEELLNVGNQQTSGSEGNPSDDDVQDKYILMKTDLKASIKKKNANSVPVLTRKKLFQVKQQRFPVIRDTIDKNNNIITKRQGLHIKQSTLELNYNKNVINQRMPKIKEIQTIETRQESIQKAKSNKKSLVTQIRLSQEFNKQIIKNPLQKRILRLSELDSNRSKDKDSSRKKLVLTRIPYTVNLVFKQKSQKPFTQQIMQKSSKKISIKQNMNTIFQLRQQFLQNISKI